MFMYSTESGNRYEQLILISFRHFYSVSTNKIAITQKNILLKPFMT